VTVHYRWCALRGVQLQCRRQLSDSDGDYLDCELPDGAGALIPSWMTDPVVCAGFSFGAPLISLQALIELRLLLNAAVVRQDPSEPQEVS
jgi:hypothetical protein